MEGERLYLRKDEHIYLFTQVDSIYKYKLRKDIHRSRKTT